MTPCCRHCGQPIRWGFTRHGTWLPLSHDPSPEGRHMFTGARSITRIVGVDRERAQERGVKLYRHHAEECPRYNTPGAPTPRRASGRNA